jgi:hypothetical protein
MILPKNLKKINKMDERDFKALNKNVSFPFLKVKDLKKAKFVLNEEDDSWHKDGFAVSVNEETNQCIFFIEHPPFMNDDIWQIKEFQFKYELNELWRVIKGKNLFKEV